MSAPNMRTLALWTVLIAGVALASYQIQSMEFAISLGLLTGAALAFMEDTPE